MHYQVSKCPCGQCSTWHVEPVAAIQGVSFTEEEARVTAAALELIEVRTAASWRQLNEALKNARAVKRR